MPSALASKPGQCEDTKYYYEAFSILNKGRSRYDARISLTDIKSYCDIFGVERVELFISIIQDVDTEYLKEVLKGN